jgi:hypothetical protein
MFEGDPAELLSGVQVSEGNAAFKSQMLTRRPIM